MFQMETKNLYELVSKGDKVPWVRPIGLLKVRLPIILNVSMSFEDQALSSFIRKASVAVVEKHFSF